VRVGERDFFMKSCAFKIDAMPEQRLSEISAFKPSWKSATFLETSGLWKTQTLCSL
jgi:hypothetical protein